MSNRSDLRAAAERRLRSKTPAEANAIYGGEGYRMELEPGVWSDELYSHEACIGCHEDSERLADFAAELLTREWLTEPTERGLWLCVYPDGEVWAFRLDGDLKLDPGQFNGCKWQRAFVPEGPK